MLMNMQKLTWLSIYLIYLLLFRTQIRTKLPKTIDIDSANMKNAFNISAGAGNVEGQPLPFSQQELLDKDGATSSAPLVESNIVGACRQRTFLLNKAFRSYDVHCLQTFLVFVLIYHNM